MPTLRKAISSVPSETFAYPTGMVPCSDENERYGHHEVRTLAKGSRVRNSSRAANVKATNPERVVLFPGLGSNVETVPRAGDRKAGSRDPTGNHSTEASGTQQEKSAYLPVLRLRRSQNIRCPSVPPMLAFLREEIGLTVRTA